MHFEKDSIAIDVNIEEDGGAVTMTTVTKVKDTEIYPTLNYKDNKVMDRIMDIVANQQRAILNERTFWLNPPKTEKRPSMLNLVCKHCGYQFPKEEPCGGCRSFKVECPNCHRELTFDRGKKNA